MEHTKEENAVNDSLKELHQMVTVVKHDKEVSLSYMKSFERDQMLIKQEQERVNTERERLRADSEAARAERAERELILLKKQLASMKSSS